MKNATRIFIVLLAVLGLLTSPFGAAADANPKVVSAGKVFTVYPTGVDDTENIQQAFALAKAAGLGSTVQLAAGNFKTRLLEIWDFDGYLKGAGEGLTRIETFENQECQSLIDTNRFPALFSFIRGYPRISDLSINVPFPTPCQPYHIPVFGPDYMATFIFAITIGITPYNPETDCTALQVEPASGVVERVTIVGARDESGMPNLLSGVAPGGTWTAQSLSATDCPFIVKFSQGKYLIRQTTIRDTIWGIYPSEMANSTVTIGGSPGDGNYLDNNDNDILAQDFSNSVVDISYNHIINQGTGIVIYVGGAGQPTPYIASASAFNVHHNEINVSWDAIAILDYENIDTIYPRQGSKIKANVHHNHLIVQSEYNTGIVGEFLDDLVVHQNTIEGASIMAMLIGQFGPTRNGRIMANDLHNYTSPYDPIKILLGPGTDSYRVTVDEADSVLDLGTNNLVNEVPRRSRGPLNPTLSALIQHKMEKMTNLLARGHQNTLQLSMLPIPANYLFLPLVQNK